MSKNKILKTISLTTKKLYADLAAIQTSSEDSDFDFATFSSNTTSKRKKKIPRHTLKRSKRQGMCLCEGDDVASPVTDNDEQHQLAGKKISKETKKHGNLVEIKDDKGLEDFMLEQ